jgi:hypothetical protein
VNKAENEGRDSFFAKFSNVYTSWFPEKAFTLENFKRLPKDISSMVEKDMGKWCVILIIKTGLDKFKEAGPGGQNAFIVLSLVIQKLMLTYGVDSVDIEEGMEETGFTETQKQQGRMLLI